MSEYVVIYEQGQGSWSAFLCHLPVFGVADSRQELERLMREAIEFTLEGEGDVLPHLSRAVPGEDPVSLRRRADGTWVATLESAPNVTATGASPDQVAYLIAEAAAAYRELLSDEPAVRTSNFEATTVRVPALAVA